MTNAYVCVATDEDVDERVVVSENAPSRKVTVKAGVQLPLWQSVGLAASYVVTSMAYLLCVRYSKLRAAQEHTAYNSATLVLMIELLKIVISIALKYMDDGEFLLYSVLLGPNRARLWYAGLSNAIPSFLYAVCNNLTFLNLDHIDPGTYQVFIQTRILFTGILYVMITRQALGCRKWAGLVLLTLSLAVKYFFPASMTINGTIFGVLLQALLSSLAGVYNEKVLKKDVGLSIHHQNFFMYLYAIGFNVILSYVISHPSATDATMSLSAVQSEGLPGLWVPIVILGAGMGLSAAFILKFINVIVKAFASSVEVLLTAMLAALFLNEQLTIHDTVAAIGVMAAIYVYYMA